MPLSTLDGDSLGVGSSGANEIVTDVYDFTWNLYTIYFYFFLVCYIIA